MTTMQTVLAAGVMAAMAMVGSAQAEIRRVDFRVPGEAGIALFVRELVAGSIDAALPPVLLLHGARVPGIASFDLPVAQGSLAADLAQTGHRVFVMDARGYGASTRLGQDGPRDGAPLVRSEEVVRDIAAVVAAIRARTGARAVALLGWATGGHWLGMYASRHPGEVSHLILYNTLYGAHAGHPRLAAGGPLADPRVPGRFDAARSGAFAFNTADSLLPSWDASIPEEDKAQWRDPAVLAAYQAAALASDPTSGERSPPAFRAPMGAIADSFELASGRKLWDAATITARVLIMRSGNDFWSRPEDVAGLQRELTSARSLRAVTIPGATHYVHLDRPERGRDEFLRDVAAFLRTD
ncbi:alpha/beta fold hydrolase [Plastoroseomonas hellenica]|nr:alpha/beta hydrolase [Plastoroseomonas hellenica]